jgi:DNA mismatch endonuclease, patch repair protein
MDTLSKALRSANMSAIRSQGMKPEMIVRSTVHKMGYRFRLHGAELPGKPDLVFASRRCVIFVNGCFWHQHAKKSCLDGRLPKSNREYWIPKLSRNVQRDKANRAALRKLGWRTLVVWECETKDAATLQRTLLKFLEQTSSAQL